ncbi:DUF4377 domain-containing protein [Bizionia sp. M204]|uniref:DUF4377 domain-containing protein n=1 Tax=unclassified Bizionia TaxID=2626393 RepID=UPI00206B19AA|nr:DUF4377 domain-containing protein [Bizionia sp. M204]UPS92366.1 DUF4377 domain-containing protein [Bizionia sp. M204]
MKLENILFGLIVLITFSCSHTDATIMYIANEQVDCVGVSPQKCMQIKFNSQDDWTFYYGQIEGFTFETGYYYKLSVSKETMANPPADASSIKYTLVEILEKSTTAID